MLQHVRDPGVTHYGNLNPAIIGRIKQKSGRTPSEVPLVVVVGTFHSLGGLAVDPLQLEELLVGRRRSFLREGKAAVEPMEGAFFNTHRETGELCRARQNVSAAVVAALHGDSLRVLGVLNPNAARRFYPDLLPDVPFARLRGDAPEGKAPSVEWVCGQPTRTIGDAYDVDDQCRGRVSLAELIAGADANVEGDGDS